MEHAVAAHATDTIDEWPGGRDVGIALTGA